MNKIGLLIGGLGLLLLFAGLAMPSTQTYTSTTCIDSEYEPASGCVQTDYTSPNFSKGAVIVLGLTLTIGGGLTSTLISESLINWSEGDEPTREQPIGEATSDEDNEQMSLHEQIKQQQEEQNEK